MSDVEFILVYSSFICSWLFGILIVGIERFIYKLVLSHCSNMGYRMLCIQVSFLYIYRICR